MTLGETIELHIYRFVEQGGKGQRRSVLFPQLTQLVLGATNVDVIDALVRLHDRGFIKLERFERNAMNYVSYAAFGGRGNFFNDLGGDFGITLTPQGRLDIEHREQALAVAPSNSCLLYTSDAADE